MNTEVNQPLEINTTETSSANQIPDVSPVSAAKFSSVVPPSLADSPDPELLAHFPSEADCPPAQAPLRTRRIEIKARTGSFLQKLTRGQQDQLFRWLGEYSVPKVAELIAQPPPAGFGFNVQHTTLRRIRSMIVTMKAEDDFENSAHAADSLSEIIDANRIDFAPVIADLLLQKTFDLTRNTSTSASDLKEVVASFVKLRELELKARRLEIESSRARIGAGPKHHHVDLNIIPPVRPSPQPAIQFSVLPRRSPPPSAAADAGGSPDQ
jgi:hypothetical protein